MQRTLTVFLDTLALPLFLLLKSTTLVNRIGLLDISGFHKDVVASSIEALWFCEEQERSFHVTFLNVKGNRIAEAREKIMKFQNEFSELFEQCPGDDVYQLSLQFFPLTAKRDN